MAKEYVYCKACKSGPCLIYCTALDGLPKDLTANVAGRAPDGNNYSDFGRDYCAKNYKPTKFMAVMEWLSIITSALLMRRK